MESCAMPVNVRVEEIYNGNNQNELYMDYLLSKEPFRRFNMTYYSFYGFGHLDPQPTKFGVDGEKIGPEKDTLFLDVGNAKGQDRVLFACLLDNLAKNTSYDHIQLNFQNQEQREVHQDLGGHLGSDTTLDYSHKIRILRYHFSLDRLVEKAKDFSSLNSLQQ